MFESFVSRYENHFDQNQNLDTEQAINEEFSIAVNGPNIAQCDSIVKEAMDNYLKDKAYKWHFFRISVISRTKYKFTSQVLARITTSLSWTKLSAESHGKEITSMFL